MGEKGGDRNARTGSKEGEKRAMAWGGNELTPEPVQLNQPVLDQLNQAQITQLLQELNQRASSGKFTGNCLNSDSKNLISSNLNRWTVDSGATDHMVGNPQILSDPTKPHNIELVTVANGSKVPVTKYGSANIFSKKLSNVLYLPTFTSNLLSISKITKELNCNVVFSYENVTFQDKTTGKKIGEGQLKNGLYVLDIPNKACFAASIELNKLWHYRIGHPSDKVLNKLFSLSNLNSSCCDVCRFSKQTRLPFSLSDSKTSQIFELVHFDVWGPAPINSYNSFRYYVTFIDDYSRTTWIYLLKTKDEVFSKFQEFTNYVENQYNTKIKKFRSDNGTEYINKIFSDFLKQKGILHQTTCINTPEQNGVSERKNRHILEVTRSLLFQSNVPKRFWSDAMLTAVYLINRLPSTILNYKIPLEILNNRKMNLDHLRIFGCTCFVHIKRQDKLDKNAVKTIFLGYSSQKKGYKCYDPIKQKLYISRDITFFENVPFYKENKENEENLYKPEKNDIVLPELTFFEGRIEQHNVEEELSSGGENGTETESSHEEVEVSLEEVEIEPRRSIRITRPSSRLHDFVTYNVSYPIQDYISYDNITTHHKAFLTSISQESEPNNYVEAKENPTWLKAMKEELKALEKKIKLGPLCLYPKEKNR